MTNKKYELTDETMNLSKDVTLHRIRALIDVREDVKKGDIGGWIQEEVNLDQDDTSWVYDNSMVFNRGRVLGNATVKNNSVVYDGAIVQGDTYIEYTKAYGNTNIRDNVKCLDYNDLHNVDARDNSVLTRANLYDVMITDNATVTDSKVNNAIIIENAVIDLECHDLLYKPFIDLYNNKIGGEAHIRNDEDFISLHSGGLKDISIYKTKGGEIEIFIGEPEFDGYQGNLSGFKDYINSSKKLTFGQQKKIIKLITAAADMIR